MSKENPNKIKPIYYNNIKHYIAYEMATMMLISKSKELDKMFCVKKSKLTVKPLKNQDENK